MTSKNERKLANKNNSDNHIMSGDNQPNQQNKILFCRLPSKAIRLSPKLVLH